MGTHQTQKRALKQATRASGEEKGWKEPRSDLENKKGKVRMKNQGIGQDGMGWERVLESLCLGNSHGKSKCRIKKGCKNSL